MTWRGLNLWVLLAVALATPPVASAAPGGSAAGWRSPAGGSMDVFVQAIPDPATGAALSHATATLGGVLVAGESFGDGTCSVTCPAIVVLAVDTHVLPDGDHRLVVTIYDVDGAEHRIADQTITVDNRPHVSRPSVTLQIGSGTISPPSSPPGGGGTPAPGSGCRAPQLSMRLADKPLRYRRGVPVLARGKTYRFAGRLTCRIDGRRRPAPRGMQVQVRSRLREGWTVVQPPVEVRKAGEIVARLAYRSSRTVIFRVRGAGGELVRVRIPIRVVRR